MSRCSRLHPDATLQGDARVCRQIRNGGPTRKNMSGQKSGKSKKNYSSNLFHSCSKRECKRKGSHDCVRFPATPAEGRPATGPFLASQQVTARHCACFLCLADISRPLSLTLSLSFFSFSLSLSLSLSLSFSLCSAFEILSLDIISFIVCSSKFFSRHLNLNRCMLKVAQTQISASSLHAICVAVLFGVFMGSHPPTHPPTHPPRKWSNGSHPPREGSLPLPVRRATRSKAGTSGSRWSCSRAVAVRPRLCSRDAYWIYTHIGACI